MKLEEFKKQAKDTLDQAFDRVEKIEKKRAELESSAKAKYDGELKKAKERRDELQARYQKLEMAAEGKWEEAKTSFEKASKSFEEGCNELKSVI